MWDGPFGQTNIVKHCIERTRKNTQPVRSAPYRAGPKTEGFKKVGIDKMLWQKVIEPAMTKWHASIVFAPRKDRSIQFRFDYQKLNAVTRPDSYPILRVHEGTDSLENFTVFFGLDANNGYWNVEADETDRNKPRSSPTMDCIDWRIYLPDWKMPQKRFSRRRKLYCSCEMAARFSAFRQYRRSFTLRARLH